MANILLIKTGAAGDVVRTTTLLHVLQGAVTWVIDPRYQEILPIGHPALQRICTIDEAPELLRDETFDLTISLEEDSACTQLASAIATQRLIGVYATAQGIAYTDEVKGWYDMSLVSRLGRHKANELKVANTHSFQYWLFQMLERAFNGEPYCMYRNPTIRQQTALIGIESRSGHRWPNKAWAGYAALTDRLRADGFECLQLEQRNSLRDYLDDIARCEYLVSGDTLAMHVALAYGIPSLAIFNCTSPAEIYDYGLLQKVVSPLLGRAYYGRDYLPEVVASIDPDQVYDRIQAHYATVRKWQKV
ncbi:glycosyltransferase family 9 protein [Paraflavitalea pollutisoli]|uniref:glycosyltransferase family 9 protein n=1 Tax=Paraflavitalea pollutisoli TaxID=3034143 RepID=UPI0023EA997F|nr:glycosyltransferase family 9 protein [Paraflavitalea sp. H1-2-19X]